MDTKGFYRVRGNVQEFLKKLALALILITIGSVTTLGTGAYVWLKIDNARLEEQRDNLVIEKSTLLIELEEAQADLSRGL